MALRRIGNVVIAANAGIVRVAENAEITRDVGNVVKAGMPELMGKPGMQELSELPWLPGRKISGNRRVTCSLR